MELSADSSLRIDRDLSLDLSVRRRPTTDTTYYGGGINWQLDQVAINASVNYDSDERWGGLITLSTALVHQPGTLRPRLDSLASVDAGSVEVRVFEGEDGTEGEPQAGVGVKGVQVWRNATTDESGVAYLSRMPAHRQIDIEIDESTLADGELRSKNPGVSVIPRPGSYAVVEFPIIRTVELEGNVVISDGGDNKPVSRALVLLKTPDGEVVAQRRTAFDGFFLFDGIEPGDYQVSLEEPLGKRLLKQPGEVTVLGSNDVIRGLDFTLRAAEEKTLVLDTLEQVEEAPRQLIAASSPPILANAVPDHRRLLPPQPGTRGAEGWWFVNWGLTGQRELAQAFVVSGNRVYRYLRKKTPRFDPSRTCTHRAGVVLVGAEMPP